MTASAPRQLSLAGRILHRVEKDPGGCWLWQGCTSDGYGRIRYQGSLLLTHRAAYEVFVGPVPEGLQLDHLCRVRNCVNPDHLEPVTPAENSHRSPLHNAARQQCPHGHPYTPENTKHYRDRRYCLTCWGRNHSRRGLPVPAPQSTRVRAVSPELARINEARRILGKPPLRSTA